VNPLYSYTKYNLYSATIVLITGNYCPGYDWRKQSTGAVAGEHKVEFRLPTQPKIARDLTYVGLAYPEKSVTGPIGFSINGIPIYSPVDNNFNDPVTTEGFQFDQCGGLNAPSQDFTFSGYKIN